MKSFLLAVQFLTRIPITVKGSVSERDIGASAAFFPAAGLIQGVPAAVTAFVLGLLFSPDIAAAFVLLVSILINGGFHLDGLADTADGVSVKATGDPAADREKRLTVMRDSRVGSIGVIAIVMTLLLKYQLLSGLLGKGLTWEILFTLLLVPVFSKWIMVPVMRHGRAARQEGLGTIFVTYGDTRTIAVSSLMVAAIFFAGAAILPEWSWLRGVRFFLSCALPLYALGLIWVRFCNSKFGGLTGDTIGAVSELGEILMLSIAFLLI